MKKSIILLVLIIFIAVFLIINLLLNSLFPSWNIHWSSSLVGAVALWGIWWYQNRKKAKK